MHGEEPKDCIYQNFGEYLANPNVPLKLKVGAKIRRGNKSSIFYDRRTQCLYSIFHAKLCSLLLSETSIPPRTGRRKFEELEPLKIHFISPEILDLASLNSILPDQKKRIEQFKQTSKSF